MVKYTKVERKPSVKEGQFTPVVTGANSPNIAVEVFLSLVKWFLVFVVINNLIWAGIHSYTLHKASSDIITSADVWQEGDTNNNNQRLTNG